jgi:MerR family copper efflux transcriptional regulator
MRIGELAERAGVTAKTLRFYEQAGLLPAPHRSPSGYRDYDETALDRLRFIRAAQAAGLTLAEIGDVIAVREHVGPPCEHVAALLDEHAAELDQRITELSALRDEVQRLRDRAKTLDPAACGDDKTCHVIPF